MDMSIYIIVKECTSFLTISSMAVGNANCLYYIV